MIYRTRSNLDAGKKGIIPKGAVFCDGYLPAPIIEKLLELQRISRVSAPPLEELIGWELLSKRLAKAGIVMADAFLETNTNELAQRIKVKSGVIDGWKQDVLRQLSIPEPHG
jgi:hypothetical protein